MASYSSAFLLLALVATPAVAIQYELEAQTQTTSGLKVETPTCKAPVGPLYMPEDDACVQPKAQASERPLKQQQEAVVGAESHGFEYLFNLAWRCGINLLIIAAGMGMSMAWKHFQGAAECECTPTAATNGWRDLAAAAQAGDTEVCRSLLAGGAKADEVDPWGRTALHHAAAAGSLQVAELLVSPAGAASVDALDGSEETPLHAAARAGHSAICERLLTLGAKVDAVNDDGHTPLFLAAKADKKEACQVLLDKGGSTPGVADADLPPLLSTLLVQRIFGKCDWPDTPPLDEADVLSEDSSSSNGGD